MASGADGTIKVKLGLDDSEYKSGLSGAHKSAESFAFKHSGCLRPFGRHI